MEKFNKIIELLEKRNLTPEEEKLLTSLQKDEESAAFVSSYRKVRKSLQTAHVSVDDLSDYVLFRNSNEPINETVSFRIPAIDAHLKECTVCAGQLKEFQDEYQEIENFVGENLYSGRKEEQPANLKYAPERSFFIKPMYAFASVLMLGFIYLALFAVSGITTPDHLEYASITSESEVYMTRGRATEEFLKSFEALENDEYETAINYLKKDIEHNPSDETIFYSYYILGLTHLEMSESKFLGLFPSYNMDLAQKGINYLEQSVEKNTSGKFDNIKLDSFFYIAKGSLMLDKKEAAKEYLQLVVSGKGSRMDDAAVILNEME